MLSASTSTPVLSICARRSPTLDQSRPGASSGWLMTLAASGTTQWACTSTVLTRFPATTTSRRPCACGADPPPAPAAAPRPAVISQPVKAIVAPLISFLPNQALPATAAGRDYTEAGCNPQSPDRRPGVGRDPRRLEGRARKSG